MCHTLNELYKLMKIAIVLVKETMFKCYGKKSKSETFQDNRGLKWAVPTSNAFLNLVLEVVIRNNCIKK